VADRVLGWVAESGVSWPLRRVRLAAVVWAGTRPALEVQDR